MPCANPLDRLCICSLTWSDSPFRPLHSADQKKSSHLYRAPTDSAHSFLRLRVASIAHEIRAHAIGSAGALKQYIERSAIFQVTSHWVPAGFPWTLVEAPATHSPKKLTRAARSTTLKHKGDLLVPNNPSVSRAWVPFSHCPDFPFYENTSADQEAGSLLKVVAAPEPTPRHITQRAAGPGLLLFSPEPRTLSESCTRPDRSARRRCRSHNAAHQRSKDGLVRLCLSLCLVSALYPESPPTTANLLGHAPHAEIILPQSRAARLCFCNLQ